MKINRDSSGKFLQYISQTLLPVREDAQKVWRKDSHIWCQDWEDIEIMKLFFEGVEIYRTLIPPFRALGNPLFDCSRIVRKALDLMGLVSSSLPEDRFDALFVPNCGRGIRVFLATAKAVFDKVFVTDQNINYERFVSSYFPRTSWVVFSDFQEMHESYFGKVVYFDENCLNFSIRNT